MMRCDECGDFVTDRDEAYSDAAYCDPQAHILRFSHDWSVTRGAEVAALLVPRCCSRCLDAPSPSHQRLSWAA